MNDDWASVPLGDLVCLEYGKALPEAARDGSGFPVLGSNGIVGYHSSALVPGPGIVVGRKGTAGSVTWVDTDFSPIDTTYWVRLRDERVTLTFAHLLLIAADLPGVCAQTGVPGLNRDRAYALEVLVPPLPVQRRIVDLMAHLDNHLANLRCEMSRSVEVLNSLRQQFFRGFSATRQLRDVARVDRGASWSAKDESVEGGRPVVRIANVQPDGLDLRELRRVVGLKSRDVERSSISDRSVLMVGSNGNPERVGNAYLSDERIEGAIIASFLIGIHAQSRNDAEYLWHFLSSSGVQRAISDSTAGTTGLKNLSIEWLRAMEIPWGTFEDRQEVTRVLSAQTALNEARVYESRAIEAVRGRLLGTLLTREIEIPASYDALLDSVA